MTLLVLLAGCATLDQTELFQIGNRIDPASINFRELYAYGSRARMAYESEATIRQRYPKTVRVASPGRAEVQYFLEIDHDAKTQFVSIRGSADSANFTEDLEFRLRTDRRSKIPIHRGFDEVAQIVYADVKPHLQKGYRTHLTGHSLGAAVSAIVMLYMYEDGVRVTRMIGFGQPRFTTVKGVEAYRRLPITRVVDANDMVPMLPPSTILDPTHGPYQQVGPEVILLDDRRYVYLDFHDANRISIGEFWRSTGFSDLKDHSMDRYLARISAKFDGAEPVTYAARQKYVAQKPSHAVGAQPN